MWTSISLLLLLIYIIYRRRQNKTNDNDEQTFDEHIPIREPSEYRLSAVRALPTIVEENLPTLTPSNSNHNFTPLTSSTSTTSPPVLSKKKKLPTISINHYLSLFLFLR